MEKKDSQDRSLSLPILLSFNELGWIAVFAMALFWFYLLAQIPPPPPPPPPPDPFEELYRQATDELHRVKAANLELLNEVDKLGRLVTDRSNDLAIIQIRLRDLEARLQNVQRELTGKIEEGARMARKVRAYEERERQLTNELAPLKDLTETQGRTIADLQRQLANCESGIAKELLSLRGSMTNVVFLLDRSASMAEGNRWQDALEVIQVWLKYLAVHNCALVTFSDDCQRFPGGTAMMQVYKNETARADLVAEVSKLRPSGHTATLRAFETAYSYAEVDTIILFTDGEPYLPGGVRAARSVGGGRGDTDASKDEPKQIGGEQMTEHMKRVLSLASQHSDIPVNVVAIGNYFDKEQSRFLLELSRVTKGAFLGR